MKSNNNFNHEELDLLIKSCFEEGVGSIKIQDNLNKQIIEIPKNQKTLSPLSRFLEREICIPVVPLSVVAAVFIFVSTLTLNSLVFPIDLPQPRYEIIERSHSELAIYPEGNY